MEEKKKFYKHTFLEVEGKAAHWRDENGVDFITPQGAAHYYNLTVEDGAVFTERSSEAFKKRGPRSNDWRYHRARSKNKKVEH